MQQLVGRLGLGQAQTVDLSHQGLYANHGYDEDLYGMFIRQIRRKGENEPSTTAQIRALPDLEDCEGSSATRKRQISANTQLTVVQPPKLFFRRSNRVLSTPPSSPAGPVENVAADEVCSDLSRF